jgi:hypothetical protein
MYEGTMKKSVGYEFDVVGTRKVKFFGEDVPLRDNYRSGDVVMEENVGDILQYINKAVIVSIE